MTIIRRNAALTYPTPIQNDCSTGKKKCVLKKAAALMKCNEKAAKAGLPADPACGQKARDKFDGGADPTQSCFERLEAKPPCLTNDDSALLEAKVDDFVVDVLCDLGYAPLALGDQTVYCHPTPTPTPTPTSTNPTPTATQTPGPAPSCTCGPGCPGCPGATATPTSTPT
jgi:hypothetical protein